MVSGPSGVAVAVALAAALACGGAGKAPAPGDAKTTATGRIRVAGNTPFEKVVLTPADAQGSELELRGDYQAELRSLAGATVRASGTLSDGAVLLVTEYEILEIAGHEPLVGVLVVSDADVAVRTAAGDVVQVRGVPAELRTRPGAKVWLIVDEQGAVQAYGVIGER